MSLANEGAHRERWIGAAAARGALVVMIFVALWTTHGWAQNCAVGTAYATVIPVVPAAAPDVRWTWSSQSPGPIEETGCSAVYGNLWGLDNANGQVSIATTPALVTSVDLTQISAAPGVIAFPEIFYGYKPFGGFLTNQSDGLVFPVQVSKLPNLWLMTNYSSSIADGTLPMNFAYDLWLTQSYKPTAMRCGDVELMIWLYHQGLTPSGTLLAQQTFTTPLWLNGRLQEATFDVYAATPNLPNHTSELVTFVLREGVNLPGANGGIPNGSVGFNLQPLLVHMQNALLVQFGLSAKTLSAEYLNGLELGEEFEPDKQEAQLTWTVSKFCVVKPKTGVPPQQTDAANFVCP